MIIEALLNMIIGLFEKLLSFINIPQIPADVVNQVDSSLQVFILRASELIDLFLPYNIAKTLLIIVIAIELGVELYHFVMWILRKIPMLGIS